METEIDQLVAGFGIRMATFCQIAKETAARKGEIARLRWTDVDFERHIVYVNFPEKKSYTGAYPVSDKCISLVKQLPREGDKVFTATLKSITANFEKQRNRLTAHLNNPRLRQIHLHTFRHWKATEEAYKTRDLFHVQRILRHKSLQHTQRYIHLAERLYNLTANDEYTVKVAADQEEAVKLLEVGFTYVGHIHGYEIFRKRK